MKRRKLWIAPAVLMFGAVNSHGDDTDAVTTDPTSDGGADANCVRKNSSCYSRQGSSCGQSVVRYGSDCGVRNYGQCRPRNNKDCSPTQMGSHCYPGRAAGQCTTDPI